MAVSNEALNLGTGQIRQQSGKHTVDTLMGEVVRYGYSVIGTIVRQLWLHQLSLSNQDVLSTGSIGSCLPFNRASMPRAIVAPTMAMN